MYVRAASEAAQAQLTPAFIVRSLGAIQAVIRQVQFGAEGISLLKFILYYVAHAC